MTCAGLLVHLLLDGTDAAPMTVDSASATAKASLTATASRHWLRVEVRNSSGTLVLLSSLLYINFPD